MKIIILIFVLFLSTNGICQEMNLNLLPGISMMVEKKYTIIEKDTLLVDSIIYRYDADGKISFVEFSPSKSIKKIEYIYSNGKLVKEIQFSQNLNDSKREYTYNKNGFLSTDKLLEKGFEVITKYKYDNKGRLTRKYSDVPVKFRMDYSYNSINQISKMVVSSTSSVLKEIEYLYDNKGNVIQESLFMYLKASKNPKKNLLSKLTFEYDESGKLIKKINHLTDSIKETFVYTYDDMDMLSQWEKIDNLGKLEFLVKYKYSEN